MLLPAGKFQTGLVRRLHRMALLRQWAKRICRGWVIRQPFHGGTILLDAIEHSWSWTGRHSYEKFDQPLQDALLQLSRERPRLIDIGSNLGAMTLSVVLRNPAATAVAVDPNPRAHQILDKALFYNRLTTRVRLLTAAVAPVDTPVRFDFAGSVAGHVTESGVAVPTVSVAELLRAVPPCESPLIKLDVEGFESRILPELAEAARARRAVVVVELHPSGLNGWGDPAGGLEILRASGAAVTDLAGCPIPTLDPAAFTQVVAKWS